MQTTTNECWQQTHVDVGASITLALPTKVTTSCGNGPKRSHKEVFVDLHGTGQLVRGAELIDLTSEFIIQAGECG
jgi:hypothetical protein